MTVRFMRSIRQSYVIVACLVQRRGRRKGRQMAAIGGAPVWLVPGLPLGKVRGAEVLAQVGGPVGFRSKAARERAVLRSEARPAAPDPALRRFRIILIKPSHYDDNGYVVRAFRSAMPANSLATVYALVMDGANRKVLGPDTAIDLTAIDETNTRVRIPHIIDEFRRNGNFGFVGLVGVQSNQYPRSLDIARPLRAAGIPVVIGGFHVSGLLAMFPELMPDLQEALDLGVSLFAGEAEGRMDEVLRDAAENRLKPIYNYINDLPALEGAITPRLPVPVLVLHHHQRAGAEVAPAQPGRRRAHHPP